MCRSEYRVGNFSRNRKYPQTSQGWLLQTACKTLFYPFLCSQSGRGGGIGGGGEILIIGHRGDRTSWGSGFSRDRGSRASGLWVELLI